MNVEFDEEEEEVDNDDDDVVVVDVDDERAYQFVLPTSMAAIGEQLTNWESEILMAMPSCPSNVDAAEEDAG